MKIYLIRHGETTGDVEDRYGGAYDDNLSKKGKEQEKELGEKLADKNIEIIYHSPLIRAEETATIVGQKLNVPLEEIKDLRERDNYGELTGITKKEAKEKYPEEVEELESNPIYHKLPHSEEYYDFAERIIASFNSVIKIDRGVIAIVTHGGPIKTIFREVLGFEIEGIEDCAIIELNADGHGIEVSGMDGVESITPN